MPDALHMGAAEGQAGETRSRVGVSARLLGAWVEGMLWVAGLSIAFVLLAGVLEAKSAARASASFVSQGVGENPLPPGTPVQHGDGAVIGRLEIPQVGLSVPVLENYDPATLKRGVGHIPGTAMPGGLGNLGLAGHRDTFLRPLRNVKRGMEVDVFTAAGKYRYQVDSFDIVLPEQTDVLDIRGTPELTLITCYPFDFVGAAPKRFIVHAHLLSLDPA